MDVSRMLRVRLFQVGFGPTLCRQQCFSVASDPEETTYTCILSGMCHQHSNQKHSLQRRLLFICSLRDGNQIDPEEQYYWFTL